MSERDIYLKLRQGGLSHSGACAVMGNMYAESGMKPDIVQRGFTAMSDAEFTAAVDNGQLDFIDGFAGGYGLCQWTYRPRKQALLARALAEGKSIGDEQMQVDFCLAELRSDFPDLCNALGSGTDINALTDRVCREYERPAVNDTEQRRRYAAMFDARLNGTAAAETDTESSRYDGYVLLLQSFLVVMGYKLPVDGIATRALTAALRDFADAVDRASGE